MDTGITTYAYLIYLAISIALTIWVARTLHKNGRVFLVDVFHGNEPLADSVNHLLVVGFYLINFGYVSLALKLGYNVAHRAGRHRSAVGQGRNGAARAGRDALLQPVHLQPHAPPRQSGQWTAAGSARRLYARAGGLSHVCANRALRSHVRTLPARSRVAGATAETG